MTEFTPGPWHIVTNKFGEHVLVETATDDNIFTLDDSESAFTYQPCLANAYLMAAAPAMFEALEQIKDEANTVGGDWRETASMIDSICLAALAKARGDLVDPLEQVKL